jgi:hypothetical protein
MNAILADRELRDLIEQVEEARSSLAYAEKCTRSHRGRVAVIRAAAALHAAAGYLAGLREARHTEALP